MQITQLASISIPGNRPPVLSLRLFEGSILVFSLLLRDQVTLPTIPLPCWHKLGHKHSIKGTCSAW